MSKNENPILVLLGATAVGKTKMIIELAELFDQLQVISADSRQIYRYMDIGTAKPGPDELNSIKHYFIDIKNPDEPFSAGEYGTRGREIYKKIKDLGKIPVVVGGSGLYIRSLIDGLFEGFVRDPRMKELLMRRVKKEGLAQLYNELKKIDPVSVEKIHPNDSQRIIRALEVWHISGKPISELRREFQPEKYFTPIYVGLTKERENIYKIIEKRIDQMQTDGLVDEVRDLRNRGYNSALQSQRSVGYREIHDFLDGKISEEETFPLIKQNTRRFAKRQLTWFNRNNSIKWFPIDNSKNWQLAREYLVKVLTTQVV